MNSAAGAQQVWDLVKLEQYGIHPERGFLPSPDPLDRLPEAFDAWEAVAHDLPKLLVTDKVRTFIDRLPILDASGVRR